MTKKTITVNVRNMQATDYSAFAMGLILRPGRNDVDVIDWLKIRSNIKNQIESGFVSVDSAEEAAAIELFRQECFSVFEFAGEAEVETGTLPGGRFCSEPYKTFAHTWAINRKLDRSEKTALIKQDVALWQKYAVISASIIGIVSIILSIIW